MKPHLHFLGLCALVIAGLALLKRGSGPALSAAAPGASNAAPSAAFFPRDFGGNPGLHLSLTLAAELPAEGGLRLRRLHPPASPATFAARLRKNGLLPICHPEGRPPTPENLRIVTREITLQLAGKPSEIRLPGGFTWHSFPPHAPGFATITAPDPLAAIAALPALRQLPGIAGAEVQMAVQRQPKTFPGDPLIGDQWHLRFDHQPGTLSGCDIQVENAWRFGASGGVRGTGIRIGIVDDGLQLDHPDLAANIDTAGHWDWNGGDADPSPSSDDIHGTPCAGLAAAVADNGTGGCGAAPGATLVGLRLIAAPTTDSQEAEAFAHEAGIIDIKSNSWGPSDGGLGLDGPGPLARAALAHAAATGRGGLGTIFVWAAGNGRQDSDESNYDGFANNIHTIAVAAGDSLLRQAHYSESGANLVVCAPSDGMSTPGITTTDLTGSSGYDSRTGSAGDFTNNFGGTSASTPLVAGTVALLLEKRPDLGWRDVQEILIRSATRIQPGDPDWSENSAGLRFNRKFGAGWVNATDAVDLAEAWEVLPPASSLSSSLTDPATPIPDNQAAGIGHQFAIGPDNLRCEHVELTFSADHNRWGDLEITLTSPGGMTSRLANAHHSYHESYQNWTFSSVRHWGEAAAGVWTLHVADRRSGVAGKLGPVTLTLHGTPLDPVDPAPQVAITSPAEGATFGTTDSIPISVTATDLMIDGTPGTVSSVQLHIDGTPVASDSTAPFDFQITPGPGLHRLTATATDAGGRSATSPPLGVRVVNQPPLITSLTLSATGRAFADTPLGVDLLEAHDPDLDSLDFQFFWDRSRDGIRWTPTPHQESSLPPDPENAGYLWRCRVVASDGSSSSPERASPAVNLVARPPDTIPTDRHASYHPGLIIPGSAPAFTRRAIIHELSQGSSAGRQWIELLLLQAGSLAGWHLENDAGTRLEFAGGGLWELLPAGTLIVISQGPPNDSALPPESTDPVSGRIIASSADAALFTGAWPQLGGTLVLRDASGEPVAGLSHGVDPPLPPVLEALGPASAIYYEGSDETGILDPGMWALTTAAIARSPRLPRTGTDLIFSEYLEGSADNRALEIFNPGTTHVDLAADGYQLRIYPNGGFVPSALLNLRGGVPPGAVFIVRHPDTSAEVVAHQVASSLTFNGNDAVVLEKAGTIVDSIGRIGENPAGGAWSGGGVSTADATLRRIPAITTGDRDPDDPFDPSLEWTAHPLDDFSGLGWHASGDAGLALVLSPSFISETDGALASTAGIVFSPAPGEDLTLSLGSSHPLLISLPAEIIVPAGSERAGFPIGVIDDPINTGTRAVVVSASVAGQGGTSATLFVSDDEAPLDGVTPGAGNTPANSAWISDIRSGQIDHSTRFRIPMGFSLPDGLTLDPASGRISGTPTADPAIHDLAIEAFNDRGESEVLPFQLRIVPPPPSFDTWIAGQGVGETAPDQDPDRDGLENLIEYHLGLDPSRADPPPGGISISDGGIIRFSYVRSRFISETTATIEWSTTLAENSWLPIDSPIETHPLTPGLERVVTDFEAPAAGHIFLRLRVEQTPAP